MDQKEIDQEDIDQEEIDHEAMEQWAKEQWEKYQAEKEDSDSDEEEREWSTYIFNVSHKEGAIVEVIGFYKLKSVILQKLKNPEGELQVMMNRTGDCEEQIALLTEDNYSADIKMKFQDGENVKFFVKGLGRVTLWGHSSKDMCSLLITRYPMPKGGSAE